MRLLHISSGSILFECNLNAVKAKTNAPENISNVIYTLILAAAWSGSIRFASILKLVNNVIQNMQQAT